MKQPLSLKRSAFIRLLVITIAVVLLFYAIGLYINFMGTENVHADLQSAIDSETGYIAGEVEREVGSLMVFLQELASDSQLLRYAIAHDILSDYQRVQHVRGISDQLLRIKRFSPMVETARVCLPELGVVIASGKVIYDELEPGAWEQAMRRRDRRVFDVLEQDNSIFLLCTRYEGAQPQIVVELGLSTQLLMARLSVMRSGDGMSTALLRADGSLFAGDDAAQRRDEPGYLVSEAEIPALGLTLRCANVASAAMEPLLRHRVWVWVLTLLAAFLLAAYLLYYRVYILRPLETIFDSVRRAEETGRFLIDRKNADFDDIYAQFSAMVERIESLASRVYEEQYRAQRAELRQLQMQINPHFFYNTLFMVYRMAQADGNEEIAQLSLNLSNYYRYITQVPEREEVPLADEAAHIRQYLDIQRIRFSPRVRIEMQELPPELAQERLPPLILQPIVENAFVHGVKDKTSGGLVRVSFFADAERWGISVWDNGGRMDEAAVEELRRRLACGEMEDGSALQNLGRRLLLRYGEAGSLRLASVEGGLRVTVSLPRKGAEHAVPADR